MHQLPVIMLSQSLRSRVFSPVPVSFSHVPVSPTKYVFKEGILKNSSTVFHFQHKASIKNVT